MVSKTGCQTAPKPLNLSMLGAKVLVWMEKISHCCGSRNRCTLAQIWMRALLACHLQSSPSGRQTKDFEGCGGSYLSDGGGESNLGRTTNSWGTDDAWVDVSERTISRWTRRAPRDPEPARRWVIFLRNDREAIAAMNFFMVPTIRFDLL